MECFHCKGKMVKGTRHLAQTEMDTIFHGMPFPHGSVHNVVKCFSLKTR